MAASSSNTRNPKVRLDLRLQPANDFIRRGLYLEARKSLNAVVSPLSAERSILEAHIDWLLGSPRTALVKLSGLSTQPLKVESKALARYVEGGSLADLGRTNAGVKRLSEALEVSRSSKDQHLFAYIQLKLLSTMEDRFAPEEVDAASVEAHCEVVKCGAPELSITLNCTRGRILAKRGELVLADRHFEVARSLLARNMNPFLRGTWHLDMSVLSWIRGDLNAALEHAGMALGLAGVSGHARTRYAALGNIGLLRFYGGNPTGAESDLREALQLSGESGLKPAFLESLAQIRLFSGELQECETLLAEADSHFAEEAGAVKSWYDLAAYPTRITLALKKGDPTTALRLVGEAAASAEARRDMLLGCQFLLLRADSLLQLGRLPDAGRALSEALRRSPDMPINSIGELERVHGKYLAAQQEPLLALEHFDRAVRVFLTTGHAAARLDTVACRNATLGEGETTPEALHHSSTTHVTIDPDWAARLVDMAAHPELLGREAFAILERSQTVRWLTLSAGNGHQSELLLSAGLPPRTLNSRHPRTIQIPLGTARGRDIVLALEPCQSFEAEHLAWSVQRLINTALSVDTAKRHQRDHTTLWPQRTDSTPELGIFESESMTALLRAARQLADTDIPILITGETGCGKEVLARAIHNASRRAAGPFIAFNCTATGRDMLDSQLFGHRRGSFTGATENFLGVIRTATGGTLVLDEIGEIGLDVQPKLLRFLESSEVHPLGEGVPQRVDVRVIGATNADVDKMVADGRFREDLFYRLASARLRVPPLRERREEIPSFIRHFMNRFSTEYGREGVWLSDEAFELLLLFRWPGNVRQLMHEIRRLVATTPPGTAVAAHQLSEEILSRRSPAPLPPTPSRAECVIRLDQPLDSATAQLETMLITNALSHSGGVVEKAARRLGISRKGLFLKRRRLKI